MDNLENEMIAQYPNSYSAVQPVSPIPIKSAMVLSIIIAFVSMFVLSYLILSGIELKCPGSFGFFSRMGRSIQMLMAIFIINVVAILVYNGAISNL